jgi:hypothetical protein
MYRATDRNSSITLDVDGGPGVAVTQWISNGTDFLHNSFISPYGDDARLYPTKLSTKALDDLTYWTYHLNVLSAKGEPDGKDPWAESNDYWYQVDSFNYNNLATDAFIVGFDDDGIVQNVRSQALRSTMYRTAT